MLFLSVENRSKVTKNKRDNLHLNKNLSCCSVAVLQFQNRLYESQKLTLYLYINIEVFLGYGNTFKRTATLQRCNSESKVTPKKDTWKRNYGKLGEIKQALRN